MVTPQGRMDIKHFPNILDYKMFVCVCGAYFQITINEMILEDISPKPVFQVFIRMSFLPLLPPSFSSILPFLPFLSPPSLIQSLPLFLSPTLFSFLFWDLKFANTFIAYGFSCEIQYFPSMYSL